MSRRYIPKFLVAAMAIFVALSAQASDFWLAKDWKQWSSHECGILLVDSPWAHGWSGGRPQTIIPAVDNNSRTGLNADAGVGEGNLRKYTIQLRSSLLVREAIVRQLQFDQKYDKMSDAQRGEFDAQAAKILNRSYGDAILVHVDFSAIGFGGVLASQRRAVRDYKDKLNVSLVAEDGSISKATRVDLDWQDCTFDAVLPRLAEGVPVVKDGQRQFSIKFLSPPIIVSQGVDIPAQEVQVKFDLNKMLVNGKPNY
jgi:hypothetical protein